MTAILERRKKRLQVRRAARWRVSAGLEAWLESDEATTLGSLNDAFGEKILATACLTLMAPSALPIPSGGATHVLDVLAVVFAAQMVLARRSVWLPDKWRRRELGARTQKGLHVLVRFVRFCERVSHRRLAGLIASRPGERLLGGVILVLIVAAALAPPFSGLDTLPSLGVVLVALAILLEDAAFAIAGITIGLAGIGLSVFLGAQATQFVSDLVS
ncbi:exopolysaccharide biosynthesis protein [Aquihabitans sp. McL0605]|uniref:exopolysaccharide biosynthesis protein n=1 Tax=Aquihabitans sp. McL0605 TaxID=3415671 RepID=UPI003CFBAF12